MNKTAKTFLIIFSLSLFICIVGAGLLIYSYAFEYDTVIDHFTSGSAVVYATMGTLALGVVIGAVGYFAAGKDAWIDTANEKTSFAETFFAVLAALMAALVALITMSHGMPDEKAYLTCLYIALLFATSVFFFIKAFAEKAKKKRAFGLINAFPALLCVVSVICCYFDKSHALNSAYYTLHVLMLITFLFNFTLECGMEVDSPCCTRKYLFGAACAVSAGGAVVISELVETLSSGAGFTSWLLDSVFYTVIWLYITVRFARRTVTAQIKENQMDAKKKKADDENAEAESTSEAIEAEETDAGLGEAPDADAPAKDEE